MVLMSDGLSLDQLPAMLLIGVWISIQNTKLIVAELVVGAAGVYSMVMNIEADSRLAVVGAGGGHDCN